MAKNKPNRGAFVPPQDVEPVEDEPTLEGDQVVDYLKALSLNPEQVAAATVEADPAIDPLTGEAATGPLYTGESIMVKADPEEWDGADSTSSFLIRVDLPYGDQNGTIVDRGHYLSNDPAIVAHLEHLLKAGHAVRIE